MAYFIAYFPRKYLKQKKKKKTKNFPCGIDFWLDAPNFLWLLGTE